MFIRGIVKLAIFYSQSIALQKTNKLENSFSLLLETQSRVHMVKCLSKKKGKKSHDIVSLNLCNWKIIIFTNL